MADPTSATAGIAVGVTSFTAVGATVSMVFGLEIQTILWALVGGFFGAALAPQMTRAKAVVRYFAACLLSALGATAALHFMKTEDTVVRNLLAGALSFGFYPLTKWVLVHGDGILSWIYTRWTGSPPPPPDQGSKP